MKPAARNSQNCLCTTASNQRRKRDGRKIRAWALRRGEAAAAAAAAAAAGGGEAGAATAAAAAATAAATVSVAFYWLRKTRLLPNG